MSDLEIDDDSEVSVYEETDSEVEEEPDLEEEPELEDVFVYEEEPELAGEDVISEEELNAKKYTRGISSYKEALMRKYAEGQIDDAQYFTELLELEIFENSQIKSFPVTEEGLVYINELRSDRLLKKQAFIKGEINEQEYNTFYINSLRDEKQAFKDYKDTTKGNTKEKIDLSKLSVEDRLDYLIKKEDQIVTKLAKKHGITLRKPNSRLGTSTDPEIRAKYLYDLNIYEENKAYIMSHYMEGYKAKVLNPTGYTTGKFEIDTPVSVALLDIVKIEPKKQLISDKDVLEQESKKYMQNLLRSLPKSILIECLRDNDLLSKETSYIQNLRINKVPILKFSRFPKDQEELDAILSEELIGKYSVTREIIDSSYTTKTFQTDSIGSNDIVCVPGKNLAVKIPFKGVSRGYIGKTIEIVLKKGVEAEGFETLADQFEPIYPVPDPLYNKIAMAGDLENKVAYVYQLYIPVPGFDKQGVYVTRRYTDFEEYLVDLKGLLSANLLKLEDQNYNKYSIAILQSKINKINYYLEKKEDPDLLYLEDPRVEARIQMVMAEINEIRTKGKGELNNFILSINASAIQKVESLEERVNFASTNNLPDNGEIITTFNKATYTYLIEKILLILTQYPDMLQDYIYGSILPDDIINFDVPFVTPDDFTRENAFKLLTDVEKLNTILEWMPNIELYTTYKKYVDEINSKPDKTGFKTDQLIDALGKDSIVIDKIQAEKIIQEEYEYKFWEDAKIEVLKITKIPPHFTPELWKFKQLNKKKYTLPSQRIYRVASIRDRVDLKSKLNTLFLNCQLENSRDVAYMVENVIYTKSKLVNDYKKFSEMILSNYQSFCSYVKEIVTDKVNIINYVVAITEYFYKEGEKLIINKTKVEKIISSLNSDILIDDVFKELSREELDIYRTTLTHTVSPDVTRRFKLLKTVTRLLSIYNKSYFKLFTDNAMIYVKPHVELTRPPTENYIFYNGNYLVGGKYPRFKDERYSTRNYSTDDIQELCILLGIDYEESFTPTSEYGIEENDFDNYIKITRKISDLTRKDIQVTVEKPKRELDYKIYTEPIITMQYTLRPRMGVPNPGEVYYTSKDYIKEYQKEYPINRDYFERSYGVPYKFDNFIPVYHIKLKELAEQKLIILEGPAIFKSPEEDKDAVYITSPYHIFIEYKDTFGKIVYFREGVSPKKVITARKDTLDTCGRFKNMESCNDPNSFSLGSRKCYWTGSKCESSFFPDKQIVSENIWEFVPDNEELKLPWSQALLSSKKYIHDTAQSQNLGEEGIARLLEEQTKKLSEYKIELQKTIPKKPKVDTSRDTSLLELIKDITKEPDVKPRGFKLETLSNYELLTVKSVKTELKTRSLTSREIKRFKRFELSDIGVVNIISVEKDFVKVENDEFKELEIPFSRFVVKDTVPTISVVPMFAYISIDDYRYLQNPPSNFVWKLKTLDIDISKFTESEDLEYSVNEVKYIDTSIIIPSGDLNGTPLIKRTDIDDAMIKLAFSEYLELDSRLQIVNKINATPDAIKLALSENISLFSTEFKFIIREITTDDVVNVIESKRPRAVTLIESLNKQLDLAIKESDKKEIESLLKQFEKISVIPESQELADAKLAEIKSRVGSRKIKAHDETIGGVKVPDPEKEEDIEVTPKVKKDVSKAVKSFKNRSVVSSRRNI